MSKKVIIITHIPFWRRDSGDRARLYALVNFLSKTTILTIGYLGEQEEDQVCNCFKVVFFADAKNRSLRDIINVVREYVTLNTFDSCIIEYAFLSFILDYLPGNMMFILDAHDIVSDRIESFRKFDDKSADITKSTDITDLTRQEEYDYFMKYDYVMLLKKSDCDKVGRIIGEGRVILARHPAFGERQRIRNLASNIGYIASNYIPNIDAINWFLKEVWPYLEACPITLNIYGSVADGMRLPVSSTVRKAGMVANIDQIYNELDIVINPVRFGAGLKIKNIEALAHGLPLITTPHGAEGIEEVAGTAFFIARDAEEFRRHISTLAYNYELRRKLGEEAYNYGKRSLSEDSCFGQLLSRINGV